MDIKVAIADYNESHATTIRDVLYSYDCAISLSSNAKELLQTILITKPDLIISNDTFDDGYVWDIAHIVRNIENYRPYIIVLSSFPTRKKKALSEEFGVDAYYSKPVQLAALFLEWIERIRVNNTLNFLSKNK